MLKKLDYDKIKQLKSDGLSVREIAATYNCAGSTIYQILSGDRDIMLADYNMDRRRKLKPSDLEEISRLYAEGVRVHEIAKRFHVTDVTIRYHLYPSEKERINSSSTMRRKNLGTTPEIKARINKTARETQRRRAQIISKIKKGDIKNV